MHPMEILEYYRKMSIDRMLHPHASLIQKENPYIYLEPGHKLQKTYPPISTDATGWYFCYLCKNNELPYDRIHQYSNKTLAIFRSVKGLKTHYSHQHKSLVKVSIVNKRKIGEK